MEDFFSALGGAIPPKTRSQFPSSGWALLVSALVICVATAATVNDARARRGGGLPAPPALVPVFPPPGPNLPVVPANANGFNVVGFVQSLTVTGGCPATTNPTAGGTVTINGVAITIPANTIVQFPASSKSWAQTVCPEAGAPALALDGTGGTPTAGGAPALYPSIEMNVIGNIVAPGNATPSDGTPPGVGATHIAALVYVSQQSLNSGSGYISSIDYNDGSIYVTTGAGSETRLRLNDPKGVFGKKQGFDSRFTVDGENPSVRSAGTGYPMCVPRSAPAAPGGAETDDDCPQKNRPKFSNATPCRNFAAAGIILPKGVELTQPAMQNAYCSAFVMQAADNTALPGVAAAQSSNPANVRTPNDPDPRKQAPLEVGDFIAWKGTLVRGGNTISLPAPGHTLLTPDLIWAHSIEANVGIFTQPRTLPAYVAIGEFKVGVCPVPLPLGCAAGAAAETTDRFVFEAVTSDIASLIDVYFIDSDPATGKESYRWLTLDTMTDTLGEQANGPFATSAQPFGGGIQTQFTDAAPGRARLRVNKVPAIGPATGTCPTTGGSVFCAITQSPTRYIEATLRSLCAPNPRPIPPQTDGQFPAGTPAGNPGNLDGGPFFPINGSRPALAGAEPGGDGTCLQSARFAHGLFTGQFSAPTPEFIFAENVVPGSPIVPSNFWQLDFLVRGEGGGVGKSAGPLAPKPWLP